MIKFVQSPKIDPSGVKERKESNKGKFSYVYRCPNTISNFCTALGGISCLSKQISEECSARKKL